MEILEKIRTELRQLNAYYTQSTTPKAEDHGEYVDGAWVQEEFNLSRQTLHEYRRNGVIPYTYFNPGGKIYYRKADLYEILENNFTGNNPADGSK
ncbi:MAG: helix-turn-helix domain-containing protein [Bacteroidota bacterium]